MKKASATCTFDNHGTIPTRGETKNFTIEFTAFLLDILDLIKQREASNVIN